MRTPLALLLMAAALPCQGTFSTFGSGCSLGQQVPSIGHSGLPRIGASFAITYTGPNHTSSSTQTTVQPILALGFQALSIPIPEGLLIHQPAGCTGYIDPIGLFPMAPNQSQLRYETSFRMSIPNDVGFIGLGFLAQWMALEQQCGWAGCGPSAILTSDGAIAVIGQ